MSYPNGQIVVLPAAFYFRGVELRDPALVTLRVKAPGEEWQTYIYGVHPEITKLDGLGAYEALIPTEGRPGGLWRYEWKGTEPAPGVSGIRTFSVAAAA